MENIAIAAQTGVTEAAAVPFSGEDTLPAAGVQEDTSEFEALIRGRFKNQFDEKMQSAIKARLKGAKEIESRYQTLQPALEKLAQRYGLEAEDAEGLCRAILGQQAQDTAAADRIYSAWLQQAQEAKNAYPAFELQKELADDQFRALLRSGVGVRTAYEARHMEEFLPAAMAATAKMVEEKIARGIASGGNRPAENAMGSRASVVAKADVSKFTRSDVEAVARRVARGERVSFG